MRALFLILALATLAACDTAAPHPVDRCPAPWLPDACPDSLRVPW